MSNRTLAVVTARLDAASLAAIALGRWPRKDFVELIKELNADVIDLGTIEQRRSWRLLKRLAGPALAQAWVAFCRRQSYDRIFCDGEHIGIPLALLMRLSRKRPRLVLLGHLLTTRLKRAVFRWFQPQKSIDSIIVHGSLQRQVALREMGLAADNIALLPYQADCQFWSPRESTEQESIICSGGLEYRDYPTLLTAVDGLDVQLVIAASSRWSRHRDSTGGQGLPSNVSVTSLDYVELRELYARARFVVVPLHEIDNPAGITTILEAMAMGKALIVSATRGQRDVVRGPLVNADGVSDQVLGGPAIFGVTGRLARAETGLYVVPGDVGALRMAIAYFLSHPHEAEARGANGRELVSQFMSLDLFVRRVASLVKSESRGEVRSVAQALKPRAAAGHRVQPSGSTPHPEL